jgi:hypothetical protein
MPIALVPEGFTLKKVTKAQEDALKDHRKHEDFKAFLGSSGSGKGLGLGVLGIVLLIILPFIILMFIKRMGNQDPNATFSEYASDLDFEKAPVTSILGLYGKAAAGIPETLQNVILPEPIRREIEKATGFDVDVGNVFEPLFSQFTQLQAQAVKQKEEEANK